jgi:hypothetical protein
MSSRVSWLNSVTICSSDMPAASYDSTSPAVMRVPRTHGFPNRTLWVIVIRSRGDRAANVRHLGAGDKRQG